VKTPAGAKDLVDVRRTNVFGDGHGDFMLGYGLASNSVWVFETSVDEVDGGKFFEVEDAEGVQGETLTAIDAQWEAAVRR